jgi:hypothetical protein
VGRCRCRRTSGEGTAPAALANVKTPDAITHGATVTGGYGDDGEIKLRFVVVPWLMVRCVVCFFVMRFGGSLVKASC